MMAVALVVVSSNADQLSMRVRRAIPANKPGRFLAFLFFNGAAGGLLWVGAVVVTTALLSGWAIDHFPGFISANDDNWQSVNTSVIYCFAYALTAVFIQRKFLPRRPARLTGLIAILLAGGWAIVPSICLFFLNQLSWKSVEGLQLGNLFNVFFSRDSVQLLYHRYFATAWLVLMVLMNSGWFIQKVRHFRPREHVEYPPARAVVPPAAA